MFHFYPSVSKVRFNPRLIDNSNEIVGTKTRVARDHQLNSIYERKTGQESAKRGKETAAEDGNKPDGCEVEGVET